MTIKYANICKKMEFTPNLHCYFMPHNGILKEAIATFTTNRYTLSILSYKRVKTYSFSSLKLCSRKITEAVL